jgi:hypothetical protein
VEHTGNVPTEEQGPISHYIKQGGTLRREFLNILANGQIGQKII